MELVELMLRWEVIVGAAIAGAAISMIGSALIARDKDGARDGTGESRGGGRGTGRTVLRAGYAITFFSIALFIVAGFMSGG